MGFTSAPGSCQYCTRVVLDGNGARSASAHLPVRVGKESSPAPHSRLIIFQAFLWIIFILPGYFLKASFHSFWRFHFLYFSFCHTTLAKKKNHHRDSRREERCSRCDIMFDQARSARRASPIRDCPRLLPCADRAWSSMISHVEQRSSRRESRGWFFFLARVVYTLCNLPAHAVFFLLFVSTYYICVKHCLILVHTSTSWSQVNKACVKLMIKVGMGRMQKSGLP